MIRRPLCTACILFLIVQAVRVCVFQCAEDQKPSALESAVSEGTRLTLTGTVDRIEEKNKVTALFLEDNAVSASGQQISEPSILVYINPDEIQKKINIGNVIQVQHKNGFLSIYKHNELLLKEVGDRVVAGEAIALVGNTGKLSTGPHLHFELWYKGVPVNPEEYIAF